MREREDVGEVADPPFSISDTLAWLLFALGSTVWGVLYHLRRHGETGAAVADRAGGVAGQAQPRLTPSSSPPGHGRSCRRPSLPRSPWRGPPPWVTRAGNPTASRYCAHAGSATAPTR